MKDPLESFDCFHTPVLKQACTLTRAALRWSFHSVLAFGFEASLGLNPKPSTLNPKP
jgi:hypothetical protein